MQNAFCIFEMYFHADYYQFIFYIYKVIMKEIKVMSERITNQTN